MKITNFTFSNNSLVVYFDVEFKQINYVKMESQSNESHGTLECEEMEIKYSKKKNTLNLFISDITNTIVLLITTFDNNDVCYSYYMTTKQKVLEDKQTNMDLMARGFKQLFKSQSNILDKEDKEDKEFITAENAIKIYPIKNQNIFANIKKKV
jgi:hypothetical protein